MHLPSHACRALAELHPQLRLAWKGRPPSYAGELNAGSAALVQLYHWSDVGQLDSPFTMKTLWGTTDVLDAFGNLERVRDDWGPVFAKDGGVRKDYVWGERYPIYVANLPTHKISSLAFMDTVKRWMKPIWEEHRQTLRDKGKELDNWAHDYAKEGTRIASSLTNKDSLAERHGYLAKKHMPKPPEVNPNEFEQHYLKGVPKEAPKSRHIDKAK